ncbi:MAG: arginine repressor [Lachnospiraceae bacterium]|nr:arginine repressor [Lachnospiraceae bacterium]MBR4807508.1 arginine repressor [Lachnospiraceae bacterium]
MKNKRQTKIIELVTSFDIGTQEELADRLSNAGFNVTQATVSRDIRELKLSKVNLGDGRQRYVPGVNETSDLNDKYERALRDGFVSADRAVNMLVIKTFPGMAMASAAALDAIGISEIMGSIAGDDTIMCATAGEEAAEAALKKIRKIVE